MMSSGGKKLVYLTNDMSGGEASHLSSKSDYFDDEHTYIERDTSYAAPDTKPALGKFFGLTGTTSQNIQVRNCVIV